MTAQTLINRYRMAKIPHEGCWFALTHQSPLTLPAGTLPARFGDTPRLAGSAIYALITRADFSALHRLAQDEIWHFYLGDPIELLLLHPDGRAEIVILGTDLAAGQHPQFTVPADVWMGARPSRETSDAFSFFGCTLAPGFDHADYEPGYRDFLQKTYPGQADRIVALTRKAFIKPNV